MATSPRQPRMSHSFYAICASIRKLLFFQGHFINSRRMCLRCGEERTVQHAPWRMCTQQCMHCETLQHVGTRCPEVSEAVYTPPPGSNRPYTTQVDLGKKFWKTQAELRQTNLDNQRMVEEVHYLKHRVEGFRDTEMENQALRTRIGELTREIGHVRRERDDARSLSNEASNLHVDALQEQFILQARISKTIALLTGKGNTTEHEAVPDPNYGHELQVENANPISTDYPRNDQSQARLPTSRMHNKPRVRLPGMPLRLSAPSSPVAIEAHPDFDHSLQTGARAFDSLARRNSLTYEYVYSRAPNRSSASRATSQAHTSRRIKREVSEGFEDRTMFKKPKSRR